MAYMQRVGEWDKAYRVLKRSHYMNVLTRAPDRLLGKAALRLERQIKKGLVNDTLGLAPLSPSYLAQKLADGYSSSPLVRTGEAVRTVTTIRKSNFIFIGLPRGVTRHSYGSREDVMNIMKLHHNGIGQKERPFIINAYNQISRQIMKDVQEAAKKAFMF